MPLYEFECLDCGSEFERLVRKAGAETEVSCPFCGSSKVEMKISTFSSLANGGSAGTSGGCAPSGG